jgi:small nuclear ribonucleoprotein (snRNP)-like protein
MGRGDSSSQPRPPLGKRVGDVERVQGEHGRQIRALKDTLGVKDNSCAETNNWIDKRVEAIGVGTGKTYIGVLKWVDKYNYGILEDGEKKVTVFHKSNIEALRCVEA